MDKSLKDIVKERMDELGIKVPDLSKQTNIPKDRIYKWYDKKRPVNPKSADEKILQKWLNSSATNVEQVPREELGPTYLEQRRYDKLTDEPYMVSYVDIPALAGYSAGYNSTDFIASLKVYPILPDVDPTGAIWRYFQVKGESMEPEFREGDLLLCSQVPKEDWSDFKNYHTYVVVTDEGPFIKDVYRDSPSTWILISQNEEFEPKAVHVADVKELWVMRRHVKPRANKRKMYDIDQIRKKLNK